MQKLLHRRIPATQRYELSRTFHLELRDLFTVGRMRAEGVGSRSGDEVIGVFLAIYSPTHPSYCPLRSLRTPESDTRV